MFPFGIYRQRSARRKHSICSHEHSPTNPGQGFFLACQPPDEPIITSITTGGDAFSPHNPVSSDQKKRTPATTWRFIHERMNAATKTATIEGEKHMNTNRKTSVIKESKIKITASNLIRWT